MPKIKGPRKINRYETEFKVKAVKLSLLPGVRVKDVAASLDIHPFMLSKWRKQYRDGEFQISDDIIIDPQSSAELQRLKQLEKEHARLKEEHELLKKAIRFCSEQRQKSSRS
jgi:transposase